MTHPTHADKFDRNYTADDLAFFAEYAGPRESHKPKQCTGGAKCWVRCGPPSYRTKTSRGFCIECAGAVK